jgi:hypothetical protein
LQIAFASGQPARGPLLADVLRLSSTFVDPHPAGVGFFSSTSNFQLRSRRTAVPDLRPYPQVR